MTTKRFVLFGALALLLGCSGSDSGSGNSPVDFTSFEWSELNGDAPWAARAGLHTVELGGRFYTDDWGITAFNKRQPFGL